MHKFITTVTLFLAGIQRERTYFVLLFLGLMLLCAVLMLLQLGIFQHWHSMLPGQHGVFADGGGTPWDGGDSPKHG